MVLLKNHSIKLSEALCTGKIDTDTDRREEGTKGQHRNSVVDIRSRMGNKQTPGWQRRGGIKTVEIHTP